jgi:hypothetical protein
MRTVMALHHCHPVDGVGKKRQWKMNHLIMRQQYENPKTGVSH